jgi:putative peptide zinc metalloprotease protein
MHTLSAHAAQAYPLLVDAELRHTPDNRFLLLAAGRVFLIGELLFNVIGRLQRGQALAAVCADYRAHGPVALHEAEVDALLRRYLAPVAEGLPKRSAYLHTRFDLVGEQLLQRLCQPFLRLFEARTMAALLLLAGLLTGAFFYTWGSFMLRQVADKTLLCAVVAYGAMVGGVFFHELGHATAAARFGVAPKSIGFGFYLVFPVFFTDVTNVWQLPKKQRIIVNLAGVYFQLLFGVLLLAVFYLIPATAGLLRTLTGTVLGMNLLVILYSLNPFLRNDGYWVYSDFFELPNLMSRAILYPWRRLRLVAPERSERPHTFSLATDLPLLVYSVANYGLFCYLVGVFIHYSSHTLVPRLAQLLQPANFPHNLLTLENSLFLLKTFGFYGLMGYMTLYSLWRNYRAHRPSATA